MMIHHDAILGCSGNEFYIQTLEDSFGSEANLR